MKTYKDIRFTQLLAAGIFFVLFLGCERDIADLEEVSFPTNPEVFTDGFSPGLNYAAFGGSVPTAFDVDNQVTYNNTAASMRFEVPDAGDPRGSFAGGVFYTEGARDLSGYNALSFWAKASESATIGEVGFGNDLAQNKYVVSIQGLTVSTGWKKFIIIYLITGVGGALTHSILNLGSITPLVGASGAIFGIMGAFAFSYPHDKVVMPIPLGFIMVFRRIKVIYAVLIFAAIETVIVWWEGATGSMSSTAHFAHLGGLVAGVIIAALLLDRQRSDPSMSYSSGSQPYTVNVQQQNRRPYDFSKLSSLADTPDLQQLLNKVKVETVPQVQDVWMEHFIEKARCPVCHHQLKHFNRKIWCDNCKYTTKY